LYIDFAKPIRKLTFDGVCVNSGGKFADITVFHDAQMSHVDLVANGFATKVDLSQFANVTRIEVTNITDPYDVGWADFSFEFPQ
jgi:hypothetical protein